MHIYDTAALYGQNMDEQSQALFTAFYREAFAGLDIRTVHDCTIGAGGTALPLAATGYTVSGSDISANLLERARLNFSTLGYEPRMFCADLRTFGSQLSEPVDCVISTGNSLPHVDLDGFRAFVNSAAGALRNGGYIYFDIRNWDALVKGRAIIHAIDPKVMTAEEHRSVYLLFNWHDDGSVTFSFATCVDRHGRHESIDILAVPTYYPLLRRDIERTLADNGFAVLKYFDMDEVWRVAHRDGQPKTGDFDADFDAIQWYGVLAAKG